MNDLQIMRLLLTVPTLEAPFVRAFFGAGGLILPSRKKANNATTTTVLSAFSSFAHYL